MCWCVYVDVFCVRKATAKATAKKLMAEIFCRYRLPETLNSDQGSHFIDN